MTGLGKLNNGELSSGWVWASVVAQLAKNLPTVQEPKKGNRQLIGKDLERIPQRCAF